MSLAMHRSRVCRTQLRRALGCLGATPMGGGRPSPLVTAAGTPCTRSCPPPPSALPQQVRFFGGGLALRSARPCTNVVEEGEEGGTGTGSSGDTNANVNDGRSSGPGYIMAAHVAEAESLLREVFGPQAKIVVQRVAQHNRLNQQEISGGGGGDGDEGGGGVGGSGGSSTPHNNHQQQQQQGNYYLKVSATFRLLGFPIELAVTKGRDVAAVIENCLKQALSSDIEFFRPGGGGNRRHHQHTSSNSSPHRHGGSSLTPHQRDLKAVIGELKQLCVGFSRGLRFSVKPPRAAIARNRPVDVAADTNSEDDDGVGSEDHLWRCRAYMRDEWGVVARMAFAREETGATPSAALAACLAAVRAQLREELESPAVMLEAVRDLEAAVAPVGKTTTAACYSERGQTTTTEGGNHNISNSSGRAGRSAVADHVLDPVTHRVVIDVEDRHGNVVTAQVRRQPAPLPAYQAAAVQAVRAEAPLLPGVTLLDQRLSPSFFASLPPGGNHSNGSGSCSVAAATFGAAAPLLVRMQWQLARMAHRIGQLRRATPADDSNDNDNGSSVRAPPAVVAEVLVGGVNGATRGGVPAATAAPMGGLPMFFTASFLYDGGLVWQTTGAGRYRVEFDAHVQALFHLIEQHPAVAVEVAVTAGGGGLFPTAAHLSSAVDRHDGLDIVATHRGRWTCYALLGTLTSQLLGCYYQTSYAYFPPAPTDAVIDGREPSPPTPSSSFPSPAAAETRGEWRSRLTVSDGRSHSALPLIERSSLVKGEAWRIACLHALRENFPQQYAAAVAHNPDVDLSGDTMAKGSKYRALPREKRVAHIGNLFSLVAAFAEEDLGWRQLRIRLRNASGDLGLPQWVAEMEALASSASGGGEGEEQPTAAATSTGSTGSSGGSVRRVVAVSAPYAQVRHAKRALIYQVARRHFPAELAVYSTLDRGDALDPDTDPSVRRARLYQPGGPAFTQQLCSLLEAKHPSMAPISWQLWARPLPGSINNHNHDSNGSTDEADEPHWEGVLGSEATTTTATDGGDIVHVLHNADLFPERQLDALVDQVAYEARVVGNRGDLLIAEYRGAAGESAMAVLISALKSASGHLAGADGETLWTEFESHECPPVATTRELALYLFYAFLGGSASVEVDTDAGADGEATGTAASSSPYSQQQQQELLLLLPPAGHAVSVEPTHLANAFWFSTVTVPRLGGSGGSLPIARAVSSTKRGSVKDALVLAARHSFLRMLRHMGKVDPGVSALAAELLTEPIVERLPDAVRRDLRRQIASDRRRGAATTSSLLSSSGEASLPPFKLLMKCVYRDYRGGGDHSSSPSSRETMLVGADGETVVAAEKKLVVRQSRTDGGSAQECRLYLQPSLRGVRKGDSQLVGLGAAITATQALNSAAVVALENLFPEDLARADQQCGGAAGAYRQRW